MNLDHRPISRPADGDAKLMESPPEPMAPPPELHLEASLVPPLEETSPSISPEMAEAGTPEEPNAGVDAVFADMGKI